jgi:glycosyltransferase involved in cell wall biosynthesis
MISIIINCYNGQEFISETLKSVINQSYQDWELIFWDNRSTDLSAQIFKKFDDNRFKYFLAERHTSLGEARNLAAKQAGGDWLAFLDCDDLWFPNKLELQINAVNGLDNVGIVYSPFEILRVSNSASALKLYSYYARMRVIPHSPKDIFPALLEGNNIILSTVLVKAVLFEKVGGIDNRLKQNEDYDLLLKVANISLAICIPCKTVLYRIHNNNNSHFNYQLIYNENKIIFSYYKKDQLILNAFKINSTRYSFYLFRKKIYKNSIKILIMEGSIFWVIKKLINFIFKMKEN